MFNLMSAAGDVVATPFPAIFFILFIMMWIAIPVIGILGTIFWIFMLVDCIKRDSLEDHKILWILVIVLANLLGAVIYYFVVKHPASKLEKDAKKAATQVPQTPPTPTV